MGINVNSFCSHAFCTELSFKYVFCTGIKHILYSLTLKSNKDRKVMVITYNYSKADWQKFIPTQIIYSIPVILLFTLTLFAFMPVLYNWTTYLQFTTETEQIKLFLDYIETNNLRTGLLADNDGLLLFFVIIWFGMILFPLWIVVRISYLFPSKWIIKKLDIEPRMKLIVFKNNKPIRGIRDLF